MRTHLQSNLKEVKLSKNQRRGPQVKAKGKARGPKLLQQRGPVRRRLKMMTAVTSSTTTNSMMLLSLLYVV